MAVSSHRAARLVIGGSIAVAICLSARAFFTGWAVSKRKTRVCRACGMLRSPHPIFTTGAPQRWTER
jgi:hypothetical protein